MFSVIGWLRRFTAATAWRPKRLTIAWDAKPLRQEDKPWREFKQPARRGAAKVANRITGEIVAVDAFGNLVTNITRAMLSAVPSDETVAIRCDDHETRSLFASYTDQPPMTLIAVIGASDQLELAIVDDSAKMMLGVDVGTPVEVSW